MLADSETSRAKREGHPTPSDGGNPRDLIAMGGVFLISSKGLRIEGVECCTDEAP